MPRIEVSIGITLNVGNYESVRADARFGKDCADKEVGNAWADCQDEAEAGLAAALEGVEQMLAARKPKKESVPVGGGPRRGVAPRK